MAVRDNRSMIKITPWSMNLLVKLTSKYLVEYYDDIRANSNLNLQARWEQACSQKITRHQPANLKLFGR